MLQCIVLQCIVPRRIAVVRCFFLPYGTIINSKSPVCIIGKIISVVFTFFFKQFQVVVDPHKKFSVFWWASLAWLLCIGRWWTIGKLKPLPNRQGGYETCSKNPAAQRGGIYWILYWYSSLLVTPPKLNNSTVCPWKVAEPQKWKGLLFQKAFFRGELFSLRGVDKMWGVKNGPIKCTLGKSNGWTSWGLTFFPKRVYLNTMCVANDL